MKRITIVLLTLCPFWCAAQSSVVPQAGTAITVPVTAADLSPVRATLATSNIIGRKIKLSAPVTTSSGHWSTAADGQAVWQLRITAEAADAVLVYFDKLVLPQGGALSATDENGDQLKGPFTGNGNKATTAFALPQVTGRQVLLRAVMPATAVGDFDVYITEAGCIALPPQNAAKNTSFGDAPSCFANVNCSEGAAHQAIKRSVVKYTYPSGSSIGSCTGSLMNNTGADCKNYFLSAAKD